MIDEIRKCSYTLSSNWYKRFRFPYLILVLDILLILTFAVFAVKDYIVGYFDTQYKYNGILILIIISVLLIIRFNLSLLAFSKQKFGIFLSIIYLLIVIVIELIFNETGSPFILIFESVVLFVNKFIIILPDFLNKLIVNLFYLISFYSPLLYFGYLIFFKKKINQNAKIFDIMTGFYASTLSKKLKIMDIVVFAFQVGIAMMVGLISNNMNWSFLCVFLSLYSVMDIFKRWHFPNLTKRKKKIIYLLTIIISFGIIYTQRIPYVGLIFFISSFVFIFVILSVFIKNYLKTSIISIFSFFMIPIFCLGYNIFAYPEYGVIKKSIPFEKEKVFYKIVDNKGYFGIRNRAYKIIRPKYTEVKYYKKDYVRMLNKNNVWEIYCLPENIFINQGEEKINNLKNLK